MFDQRQLVLLKEWTLISHIGCCKLCIFFALLRSEPPSSFSYPPAWWWHRSAFTLPSYQCLGPLIQTQAWGSHVTMAVVPSLLLRKRRRWWSWGRIQRLVGSMFKMSTLEKNILFQRTKKEALQRCWFRGKFWWAHPSLLQKSSLPIFSPLLVHAEERERTKVQPYAYCWPKRHLSPPSSKCQLSCMRDTESNATGELWQSRSAQADGFTWAR